MLAAIHRGDSPRCFLLRQVAAGLLRLYSKSTTIQTGSFHFLLSGCGCKPMDPSRTRQEAIRLLEAGEPDQAGVLLAEVVRANPQDGQAWSWLARCVRTDRQREWCQEQVYRIQQQSSSPLPLPSDQATYWTPVEEYEYIPAARPDRLQRVRQPAAAGLLLLAFVAMLVLLVWFTRPAGKLNAAAFLSMDQAASTGGLPAQPSLGLDASSGLLARADAALNTAYLPALLISPPTPTIAVTIAAATGPTATPDRRSNPKKWKSWPVLPFVSENARQIWQKGVKRGNDPHAFSVLGDCHSQPDVLFARFADRALWDTPAYKPYKQTLKDFRQSWGRSFVTVANGMSVASALNPTWARSPDCKSGETPLACELRVHNPSVLIISLGTNWGTRDPDEFEQYLREILDLTLKENVLPMIATKGDPTGQYNPLNERMVAVAHEYDLPLWNFWASIQDLPNQGLKPWDRNGVYLSVEAWSIKRDTGLQALDQVRQAVAGG
jgi:hypothetical protein